MKYIKIIIVSLIMCLNDISFSQYIGVSYVSNPSSTPYGFGIVTLPKINTGPFGIFSNIKFGDSSSGNYHDSEDNSGIYQIGLWGNIKTGRQDKYIENSITSFDFGLRLNQIKETGLYPFVGCGVSKQTVIINTYIEAEDLSSGVNVLGYYWIRGTKTTKSYTQGNLCFGSYYVRKKLIAGIGYNLPWITMKSDFKIKTGVQLSIGFCF